MLKGFAITPVVLGRIAIGGIVEKNGKRLPVKYDFMQITSNVQKDGGWIMHPAAAAIADKQKGKIHSIPVRIMFDRPDLNFRAEYSAFSDKGRLLCSGDGEKARRRDPQSATGISDYSCPGSDLCEYGKQNRCKPFGRLMVGLEGEWDKDPLSGFMFRTTSFNSIRALTARLSYLAAATGDQMAGLPCNLVMRAKSTSASMRRPIYYLDIEPRDGLLNAMAEAKTKRAEMEQAGFKRQALEEAVRLGYEQSAFVEPEDETKEVVEEFYNSQFVDFETGEIYNSGDAPPGAVPVDQSGKGAATSTGQENNASPAQNEAQDSPEKPFKDMADDELWKQLDEKTAKSVKAAIDRIPNVSDEESITGARVWSSTRFGENTAAMQLIDRKLAKRQEQSKELPLEGERKSA